MKPKRIQRKRIKGWRMPEGAKYVGRPNQWGNPFVWDKPHHIYWHDADSRYVVTRDFRKWLGGSAWRHFEQQRRQWILDNIESLRGIDLTCWCPLDEPCHADVLLELANQEATDENIIL